MSVTSEGATDTLGTGCALGRRHWVSDKTSARCVGCGAEFTMMRRRHHCRSCGEVFCSECTRERLRLAGDRGKVASKVASKVGAPDRGARVCAQCAQDYEQDRNHPVYRLLGDALGGRYFYAFVRNGDADADAISSLPPDGLAALMERNGVAQRDRNALRRRLSQFGKSAAQGASNSDSVWSPRSSSDEAPASLLSALSPPGELGLPSDSNAAPSRQSRRFCMPLASSETRLRRRALAEEMDSLGEQLRLMQEQRLELDKELVRARQRLRDEERRLGALHQLQEQICAERDHKECRDRKREERRARGSSADAAEKRCRLLRRRGFEANRHHHGCCELCHARHTAHRREHHCRMCFRSVCGPCSTARDGDGRRQCDWCHVAATLRSAPWVNAVARSAADRARWATYCEGILGELHRMDGDSMPASPLGRAAVGGAGAEAAHSCPAWGSPPQQRPPAATAAAAVPGDISPRRRWSVVDRRVHEAARRASRTARASGPH
eukprot:TRINITY_DN24886_c0_g1_i1.p1 TRINITY_DN24886_c0_g1~~TRINITY_DN24886_c0_g1_i1.p1  ORF type:complete len:522 (+),score=140.57 TRINITY_DN24886_c0_g1_i1:81-1568(+)